MKNCECCKIVSDKSNNTYHSVIVPMEGGWVLNHSGSKERNYLGRLALTPIIHRTDFGDLSKEEATSLGINIQRINFALRSYWAKTFSDDPLERVYVVYFHETPYEYREDAKKFQENEHMHVHLFPRAKSMLFGKRPIKVAAWKIVYLLDMGFIPEQYRIIDLKGTPLGGSKDKVNALMEYLRESLSERKPPTGVE